MYRNGGFNLFGGSVLRYSFDTGNIGSTWCRHIDGNCQMADNRIHHSGSIIANIWWNIPFDGIAACNLGSHIAASGRIWNDAQGQRT